MAGSFSTSSCNAVINGISFLGFGLYWNVLRGMLCGLAHLTKSHPMFFHHEQNRHAFFGQALELFYHRILKASLHQALNSIHPLEPRIFFLEFFELFSLKGFHTLVSKMSFVKRSGGDFHLTADIFYFSVCLMGIDRFDDLGFCESRFFHNTILKLINWIQL